MDVTEGCKSSQGMPSCCHPRLVFLGASMLRTSQKLVIAAAANADGSEGYDLCRRLRVLARSEAIVARVIRSRVYCGGGVLHTRASLAEACQQPDETEVRKYLFVAARDHAFVEQYEVRTYQGDHPERYIRALILAIDPSMIDQLCQALETTP